MSVNRLRHDAAMQARRFADATLDYLNAPDHAREFRLEVERLNLEEALARLAQPPVTSPCAA